MVAVANTFATATLFYFVSVYCFVLVWFDCQVK